MIFSDASDSDFEDDSDNECFHDLNADLASESESEEGYDSDFDIEACSEIGNDDCLEGNDLLLFLKITMFMNSKSSYLSLIF
jgi:hypothetical protein